MSDGKISKIKLPNNKVYDLAGQAEIHVGTDTPTGDEQIWIDPSGSLSGVEMTSNKVTSISSSADDTHYPSAKAVYDLFSSIVDAEEVEF